MANRAYSSGVDALRRNDVEEAQTTPPAEKLHQAFELMATGFRLKRAKLRQEHPDASDEELERLFADWLLADD
jgi:hypothetical protein